jgi:hypothetical protein
MYRLYWHNWTKCPKFFTCTICVCSRKSPGAKPGRRKWRVPSIPIRQGWWRRQLLWRVPSLGLCVAPGLPEGVREVPAYSEAPRWRQCRQRASTGVMKTASSCLPLLNNRQLFATERWTGRVAVLELEVTFRRGCDVLL